MSGRLVVFAAETLRIAAPYVACGLGGVVTERAGLVNIALEGTLIVSGLAAAAGALALSSAWAGLGCGAAAGALFCLVHAGLVERGRVDAIVSGIALNIIAFGLSRVALRVLYESASNSPRVPGFFAAGPASPLLAVLADPPVVLLGLSCLLVPVLLDRTRAGLRLRASGDNAAAARAAGVSVRASRLLAAGVSGALCGLGGAHLVFDQHHFTAGMSGGRGFIALAAVILAGYRPGLTVLACLGFAALEAAQIALQDLARVPAELVQSLPYLVTLVLVAVVARPPRWGQRPPRSE